MSFEEPLKTFDSLKIRLYTDSSFIPVAAYRFVLDTLSRNLTLLHSWKENTRYHLVMDKEFAADSAGRKLLKTDTLTFLTKKLAEYGSFKIRFKNLDIPLNPVLQLLSNDVLYQSIPLTGNEISKALFPPGEYELRILYDRNKNGKWDPGNFFGKKLQPELVKPVSRKITVKAGGANEFDITL